MRWIDPDVWAACNGRTDIEELKNEPCYAGLDLSAVRDLTALVLVFPADDGVFDVVPFFWLPGDGLRDREDDDRVPYTAWATAGQLLTTPGGVIDPAFIAAHVARMGETYDLRMLGFDRWRIDEFQRALADTGADIPMHPVGQGREEGPSSLIPLSVVVHAHAEALRCRDDIFRVLAHIVDDGPRVGFRAIHQRRVQLPCPRGLIGCRSAPVGLHLPLE